MSISVDDARFLISQVYRGDKWKYKVKHMTDQQVIAIYFSFCEKGKFNKKPKQPEKLNFNPIKIEPDDYSGEQMWMNI